MKPLGRPGLVLGKASRVTPAFAQPEETHKPAECWEPACQDAPKSVKLSLKSSGSTGGGKPNPGLLNQIQTQVDELCQPCPLLTPGLGQEILDLCVRGVGAA